MANSIVVDCLLGSLGPPKWQSNWLAVNELLIYCHVDGLVWPPNLKLEQTVAFVDLTEVLCLIVLVHPLHLRQALSKKWQAVQWTKMARVVMVNMVIASIYLTQS